MDDIAEPFSVSSFMINVEESRTSFRQLISLGSQGWLLIFTLESINYEDKYQISNLI